MPKARVFYFNPTCELAVANGSFSYMPPLLLQEMERDLAALPFIFCTENDFVIIETKPSDKYIEQLNNWGFKTPRFCTLSELESMPADSFDEICPWGWSPAAHFKLKKLKEKCSEEFRSNPSYNWQQTHQLLFERSTSLNFLTNILNKNPEPWFINKSLIGVQVTSLEEIEKMMREHQALVLKAPLSSSGRGIQIIRSKTLNNSNKAWISGVLKQQNYLISEPYLEKLADLSFQFRITEEGGIEYLGYTFFETNSNGQYKGTMINAKAADVIPDKYVDEPEELINQTARIIRKELKSSVYASSYYGLLGVDAMLFRNDRRLMVQPCIEVNCRMNMGILTLMLQNYIQNELKGRFEIYFGKTGDFEGLAQKEMRFNPPALINGKICSGFISLVEPIQHQKFGAYLFLPGTK
jgi:hypothetical protein